MIFIKSLVQSCEPSIVFKVENVEISNPCVEM